MTKELVEDIMDLEAAAEERLAKTIIEKEAIIKKAREKAHKLSQEAEKSLDTERERRITAKDKELHGKKLQIIDSAKEEATKLEKKAEKRIPEAADKLLQRFLEYGHDVS